MSGKVSVYPLGATLGFWYHNVCPENYDRFCMSELPTSSLVPPFLVASVYKCEILFSSPDHTAYLSTHSSNEYGLGT